MQPAQTVLTYFIGDGISYIDIAEGLSQCNRRAYKQGMEYAVGKVTFGYQGNPAALLNVQLGAFTAGDTWAVHNSWTKGSAVWHKQQDRALRLVGQSAKPTWQDFKVYLDDGHRGGTIPGVLAGDDQAVGTGEWDYSRLVHVDDAEASFDEWYLHLIGGDVSDTDKGLILAYQDSRATVQPEDPELPGEYSTNMYAMLAEDVDLAAGEVAQNMEDRNDEPPYDHDDYPGTDVNADSPWLQEFAVASSTVPQATLPGFIAQCGLIRFLLIGHAAANGAVDTAPTTMIQVHLVPGSYKGVAAFPMGQ